MERCMSGDPTKSDVVRVPRRHTGESNMWIIEYDNGGVEELENRAIDENIVAAMMLDDPRIISAVKV